MNILVVGGGGREHAIIHALKKNNDVENIYALPGNGGIAEIAQCVPVKSTDITGIVDFALNNEIGFAVVAPDDPLVMGAVDALEAASIPCFGPSARAAQIEGSKVFAKDLMRKYNIPTAAYESFDHVEDADRYLKKNAAYPIVIKADGLALGKGVIIAQNRHEALEALEHIMVNRAFGESGSSVVIEEFLTGPEVSVLAFTDGKTIVPMVSSMDHKRAYDFDKGPNTGGMGTIAPNPFYTKEVADACMDSIFLPTIRAMESEGRPFKGCLYFGLMLTGSGPKVIEYNCRFGDPETQVVLPLLKTDLFTVMRAVHEERLHEIKIEFDDGAACCVVLASGGYPSKYETGKPIYIDAGLTREALLYHAGTALTDGTLKTSGGRVLGVTAAAPSLKEAVHNAYKSVRGISFENMYMRKDIGKNALTFDKQ